MTPMVTPGESVPSKPVNTKAVLTTVFVAVVVSNLDLFVVNVALPRVGSDFHGASLGALSWVLNAYAIVFAALLVPAGRIADRRGQRPGFLAGLALFTVGSALCATSTGVGYLIAARVLQATGAAILLPTSLALMLAATAPARRGAMVRAWSAVGGVSAALGPVLGGVLVQASWRWVFLINVPIGIVTLAWGAKVLPAVRRDTSGPSPDLLGAALLGLATGALSLALSKADTWGWTGPRTTGSLAATVVLLAAFALRSRRHPAPVIEASILRTARFSAATLATLLFAVSFAGMILSAALWCQNVWGYSALRTGLALAPGPLMVPPLAVVSGALARRLGAGPVSAAGNLLFGGGVLWWSLAAGQARDYTGALLPGFLVGGVGVGLLLPTLTAVGATALPAHRFATGAGILTMARQVGAVLGVAVLVAVLGTPHSVHAAVTAFRHGWQALAAVSILAAGASLLVREPRPAPAPARAVTPTVTRR